MSLDCCGASAVPVLDGIVLTSGAGKVSATRSAHPPSGMIHTAVMIATMEAEETRRDYFAIS